MTIPVIPPSEEVPGGLSPRAYHISMPAIVICNFYQKSPAETIMHLQDQLDRRREEMGIERAVERAVKKVVQEGGVILHPEEKNFFRELTKAVIVAIEKGGGES